MDAARIALKLTLEEAGLKDLKLKSFSARLNVQKRIYLVQVLGYDLGYRFGWYLHGPYCSGLTQDAFALRDEVQSGDTDAEGFVLSDSVKKMIGMATELWRVPDSETKQDDWLELLASLHYLKAVAYWPAKEKRSFEAVFKSLIESKPRFSDQVSLVQRAWQRLADFQLVTG